MSPPHLLTLADLSVKQLKSTLTHAAYLKRVSLPLLQPRPHPAFVVQPPKSLSEKTIALLFSKRSTRTRLSAESAAHLLGGHPMFLSSADIQLGVNESLRDSARVIGGLVDGIFARVGDHTEVEMLAKHSPVPVLNALSSLWHPTQILADLLTLLEHLPSPSPLPTAPHASTSPGHSVPPDMLPADAPPNLDFGVLHGLTLAWLGDSTNVLHDMLVTYPRLGAKVRVAVPKSYPCPPEVWERVKQLGCEKGIEWSDDPLHAVKGADIVVTDTWISMGQESEKSARLAAFQGYQVTESLCRAGGAAEDWKFLHCLPRKPDEVDDEVFYGKRSLVWEEAENRKWTIMALFESMFGHWKLTPED
ncbi:ornithine carbamoyltransferase [Dacryopinax primogenitus]|uniref:ornithine carbamoyltransferase n=1 Tax=Dacryopinax primogenitus (strain DJM 731) TaxID=1858805 RepID=M5FP60_DACPD|nr:ornithine carbamoyltransferase [Dacryopinax primogenitus]EJT98245.1 ornithine carbamoyltransferase [Dacryopinax primogenitus]